MIRRKRQPSPDVDPVAFYREEYAAEFSQCPQPPRPLLGLTALEWEEQEKAGEAKTWKLGDGYRYAQLPLEPLKALSNADREQRVACAASMWGSRMTWKAIAEVVRVPEPEIMKAARQFIDDRRAQAKEGK